MTFRIVKFRILLALAGVALALSGIVAGGVGFAQGGRGTGSSGMGGPDMMGPGAGEDFWQPGWMHRDMWTGRNGPADMQARMKRHWTFMHEGVPKAYAGARSPLSPTPATVSMGGKLYEENCASCHGKRGTGDGTEGRSLTPSPALLAWMIQRPVAVDEYLLWTISDGGAAFKTAMPAFKDTLSRDEIWQVIAYMRAGFPPVEDAPVKKK